MAVEIRRAHGEVEQHTRKSLAAMITAGTALIQAKELLKNTQGRVRNKWGPWVRDQAKIPARTATLYSTERASLEKKPSMRLSQEPCLGVKTNSKRPAG